MNRFSVDVYQNEFLPLGGSEVHAVLTVTAAGAVEPAAAPEAAEIVIVDTSGSMDVPRTKIKAAREATAAAIDCIRDGVEFAVVAGNSEPVHIYPCPPALVAANEQTRAEAKRAVKSLRGSGGTAIGSWLDAARELFQAVEGRVCHAILLTDGENQHETREQLEATLARCEGVFQCSCRGVGAEWKVEELRRIASALLGGVELIREPDAMAADFRAMMEQAMRKITRSVSLRVWTPQGAHVAFVRQVAPTIEDLTDRATEVNPLTAEYPTGTWGTETRDYHVCIRVPPREVGEEMLAARVSLAEGDEVLAQGLVKATWTDDHQLSTRINHQVAHYTGQAELASAIQEGLEARRTGDVATATSKLGQAVQLASESANEGTMKLLEAVVEVDDPKTGTVRLKASVDDLDEMALDTRSTRTVRVGPAS
jgi:hypothetical protein